MSIRIRIEYLLFVFLLLIWGTNLPTTVYYVCSFLIIITAVYAALKYKLKIPYCKTEDYIAFSFVLVWVYGFVNGLLHENDINYVIANFFGMSCYIMYFVFTTLKVNREKLVKIVFISGICVCLIAFFRIICFFCNIQNSVIEALIGEGVGMSSTGQMRVYFTSLATAYPLLGASLFILLYQYREIKTLKIDTIFYSLIYFMLTVSVLMFVSSSKGFLLGALFVIISIPFFISIKGLMVGKLNMALFILLLIVCIVAFFLLYFDYFSIIEMMFDRDDVSNDLRYKQLDYMLQDLTFWGKGLGATVPGMIRSDEAPYGFELTYINLVHKFGLFSIVLFSNWLYMFIKSFSFLLKKKSLFYSSVALSSLGYMFPSIGNPLLMHPGLVILNCLTLYLLRLENGK